MEFIILVLGLVMAITFHEFAHAWMGNYLGDPTAREHGRLSLNPMVHIDLFFTLLLPLILILTHSPIVFGAAKPVPFNPWAVRGGKWGAAMVALAGPATNLILATFLALWLRLVPVSVATGNIFVSLISINVAFFVFNMIPFPPLDGSRLLYAMAPIGLREVMDKIERMGMVAIALFILVGYQFIAGFIASITQSILRVLIPA